MTWINLLDDVLIVVFIRIHVFEQDYILIKYIRSETWRI